MNIFVLLFVYFDYFRDCINKKNRLKDYSASKTTRISFIVTEGKNACPVAVILLPRTSINLCLNVLPVAGP